MPDCATLSGYQRLPLRDSGRQVSYRVMPGVPASLTTITPAVRQVEQATQVPPSAPATVCEAAVRTRDPPTRLVTQATRTRVTSHPHYPDQQGRLTRYLAVLPYSEQQWPLTPPPRYVPPYPLDLQAQWVGLVAKTPPAYFDFQDDPIARFGGRQLSGSAQARHVEDRPRANRPLPTRWRGQLLGGDLRTLIPPPPPYSPPPFPLIDVLPVAYVGILSPPIIDDFAAIPVPAEAGRHLECGTQSIWREAHKAEQPLRLRWGPMEVIYGGAGAETGAGTGTNDHWEDSYPRLVIPNRWIYVMQHSVDLVLLPEGISCDVVGLDLKMSQDATAATLSVSITGPGWADLLSESTEGVPRRVRLTIDGWRHDFAVENWEQSIKFNEDNLTFTAKALTGLLGGRWWLPQSGVNTSAQFASQIAQGACEDDWTVVWAAQDWLIPAGACAWSNLKPIELIAKLAVAGGAFVAADPLLQQVLVRPVYQVAPWNYFASLTMPDIVIPYDAVVAIGKQMPMQDQATRIFLAGGEVGGLLVQATREGTDGALEAPMVADPLLTHVDVARARAERELARFAAPPKIVSIDCPFDNVDFPLLEIGALVEIQCAPVVRGIVSALSLRVDKEANGALNVRQIARLGESSDNAFSVFRRLAAQPPLELATIAAVYTDGTVLLTYPGGGSARARANGPRAEGQVVWVRGLEVQPGEGPGLGAPVAITI